MRSIPRLNELRHLGYLAINHTEPHLYVLSRSMSYLRILALT